MDDAHDAVRLLRAPSTIRERAALVFAHIAQGRSSHFVFDERRLDGAVDLVIDTTRAAYPTLDVPYHSRWRHFEAGHDRWGPLARSLADPLERGRVGFDLVIPSVLLDAGAGMDWRYTESGGAVYARSEGLAVATFRMFEGGVFSADAGAPWRADGVKLAMLEEAALARAFQVDARNPLAGLAGRAALMRRLGGAVLARPEIFGGRLGGLFDHLRAKAREGRLPARAILAAVLDLFSMIWPGRLTLAGENLGDVWRHPAARGPGASDGFVPFHKLSQWLAYSLVEPLEWAGITVDGLDDLTGLPEYRNGGLFLDAGVLALKNPAAAQATHAVSSELVIEWRAATVALLDEVAVRMRARLGLDAAAFPLAKVLQGGTWAAGRALAARARAGGVPPLRVDSDGTVF